MTSIHASDMADVKTSAARTCLTFTVLASVFSSIVLADDADAIVGVWATEKAEAHVEISRAEGGYAGSITWLKEPFYTEQDGDEFVGKPLRDLENPDATLRDRAIVGLRIMEGFRYAGDGRWVDGIIYDPENGKTYKCFMWLTKSGSLKVRGYVGVSLFGRTSEWTPVLTRATQPAVNEESQR